jgi:fluoride exporter
MARWDVLAVTSLGGSLGALGRYALATLVPPAAGGWPWATFAANVSGSFLIGVLMVVLVEQGSPHRLLRPFLGVGMIGGYTTVSAYGLETHALLLAGRPGQALGYATLTLAAALLAVWVAVAATRAATASRRRGGSRR